MMGVKNEGAGRVRMRNGGRMSLRSYKESMLDRYGSTQPAIPKRQSEQIEDLHDEIAELRERIANLTNQSRASRWTPKPENRNATITAHASEADLWN